MELSFIIPIYNTPIDALKRCVDSICKLNNVNYEIILVDDGSKEIYSKEYESISKTNKIISYYKKENSGVSATRNYGLHKANGKYVMFIDSDDEFYADNFNSELVKKDYDVIYYNCTFIYSNNITKELKEIASDEDCELNYIDMIKEFIEYDKFYAPWNKIFKREYLNSNKIEFDSSMINGEDAVFNLNVLLAKPSMYYCNKSIYGYYYADGNYENRIKNKFDNMIHDYLYKYEKKMDVIKKYSIDSNVLNNMQKDAVETCFRICMICSKYKNNKKKEMSEYIQNFNIDKNNLSLINKIKYNSIYKQKWGIVHFLSSIRNIYIGIKRR